MSKPRWPGLFKRIRSALFNFPAWFAPFSGMRVFFHRLRGANLSPRCEIGYHVLIDNLFPELVRIDRGATVVAGVQLLAHDLSDQYARDGKIRLGRIRIRRKAFVGAGAIILPGVTIGERAIVGAGSVVTRNVEPGATVVGIPARALQRDQERAL